MGAQDLSPRARLLPVLGIVLLIVALLAVARFAADRDQPSSSPAPPTSPSDSVVPPPTASDEPRDEGGDRGEDRGRARDRQLERWSRRLRDRVQVAADGVTADPATFRIASFNVLGWGHTAPGGNHPQFADGATRTAWALQLLEANDLGVVGLQEFEPPQVRVFSRLAGGSWDVYPGLRIGNKGARNSVAWDTRLFELVEGHTILIPYFHGNLVHIPYVLLKHRPTGRLLWVINTHNPASVRGPAQRWRDIATDKQIALMNELQRPGAPGELGIPTFLTGDFNERAEAFCRVTAGAAAQAANGGTVSPCRPPAGHGIDWIFGSTPGVTFSGYLQLEGGLVGQASDHPLVLSDVTLSGEAPRIE